ncbi:hypothetical protein [Peribacillus sp. SCS-155]|uniref:hypothetical protein n=1 Tax=Peribacillus sedimenti TaxID=3115297 RepID=UPI0039067C1D
MTTLHIDEIIILVTEEIYRRDPYLMEKYGERGKTKCTEDNHHHFKHLNTAFELKNSQIFIDYATWLNGILQVHGMSSKHLIENFQIISDILAVSGNGQDHRMNEYITYLHKANEALNQTRQCEQEET